MSISTPLPPDAGYCVLISDFLTHAECQEMIALSEGRGYASAATDYPPSYRNNDRHVIDAPDLAASLGARLQAHAPHSLAADDRQWAYDGINERLRFCRYGAGQRFAIHQDGVHFRGADCRSHLTILIYLTDGADFAGGDTVFYGQGPGAGAGPREVGRVRPQAGSLLIFDHAIWHAGDDVADGIKHVLRSDVLYRAVSACTAPPAHQGYVWTLAGLDGGLVASGGRDATIRVWDSTGQPVRCLDGHTRSVLGLAPLPGQRLASVSRDRTLRLWDWSTGACLTTVVAHDTAVLDVVALAGGMLATAGADGLIKFWRDDGRASATLAGHAGWVWQLATLDDGHIASASEDGTVRIWHTASLRCSAVLGGDQPLRTLLVLDGAIWTGDAAGRITHWTEGAGEWTRAAQFQAHGAAIRRLRSAGAGTIASCGEDCALRVWETGAHAPAFEAWHANFVTDVLRQGAALVTSSYDGRIAHHDHL